MYIKLFFCGDHSAKANIVSVRVDALIAVGAKECMVCTDSKQASAKQRAKSKSQKATGTYGRFVLFLTSIELTEISASSLTHLLCMYIGVSHSSRIEPSQPVWSEAPQAVGLPLLPLHRHAQRGQRRFVHVLRVQNHAHVGRGPQRPQPARPAPCALRRHGRG